MNKVPTVAIIDSGFTPYPGEAINILWGCSYHIVDGEIYVDDTYNDELGHGTQCVYTINKYCKDVSFIIIKVINDRGQGCSLLVYEALKSLRNIDVDIINISLSIQCSDYENEINAALKDLYYQGKIVNVAVANRLNSSFPACSPYCIGINRKQDMNNERWMQYDCEAVIQGSVITFPEFIPTIENRFEWFSGNSKSTAMVTGLMLKYLTQESQSDINRIIENVCQNENPAKRSDAKNSIQTFSDVRLFIKCYSIFVKHFHKLVLPTTQFVTDHMVSISTTHEMLLEIQDRTKIPIRFWGISHANLLNLGGLIHYLDTQ